MKIGLESNKYVSKLFPSPWVIYIILWKWAIAMTLTSLKLQIINMKIGGGYTRQLLQVTTLQGRNELEDFQIGMTWKCVLGLRRVNLDCEKQCFFYWKIFAKFQVEKYDFTHTRVFSWKRWPKFARFWIFFFKNRQIFMISLSR